MSEDSDDEEGNTLHGKRKRSRPNSDTPSNSNTSSAEDESDELEIFFPLPGRKRVRFDNRHRQCDDAPSMNSTRHHLTASNVRRSTASSSRGANTHSGKSQPARSRARSKGRNAKPPTLASDSDDDKDEMIKDLEYENERLKLQLAHGSELRDLEVKHWKQKAVKHRNRR